MHLTLIISSLGPGGAERVLSQLANYWASKGYQITLITFSATSCKPFYPLDSKIHLIQLGQDQNKSFRWRRFLNAFKRILYLRRLLQSKKPDVVMSFIDLMNLITILASTGLKIPIIVSERVDPHFYHIPFFYKMIRPWLYGFAQRIVVQTNSAASYFANTLQSIIKIISNPAMPARYKKIVTPIVTSLVNSIVTVGRLNVQKDHQVLIQAFAHLATKYPDLRLTIYGEGTERNNLQTLIDSLQLQEKVVLAGTTQDIDQKLLDADLFVFPSRYEGFPNALCEAMAVGLPVIASNCSGNIDIVRDTIDGRLFPIGDTSKLATLMEELISDTEQRIRLGQQAQTITDRFHSDRIFCLWDDVITEAIQLTSTPRKM